MFLMVAISPPLNGSAPDNPVQARISAFVGPIFHHSCMSNLTRSKSCRSSQIKQPKVVKSYAAVSQSSRTWAQMAHSSGGESCTQPAALSDIGPVALQAHARSMQPE